MISKAELSRLAQTKRLSQQNAEKDYLLDVLLYCISSEYRDSLVLKGGTSLYKLYNLNRFSEDLDFTLNTRRFDGGKFSKKMLASVRLIGVEGTVKALEEYPNEVNVRLAFRGPLYSGGKSSMCTVTLNISHRERVLRPIKRELAMSSSREVPAYDVYVMDLSEIMAEKVRATMTREKPRDVYDIWYLLRRGVAPEPELANAKLKLYSKTYAHGAFEQAVRAKRGAWEADLSGLIIGELPGFDDVCDEIMRRFAERGM